MSPTMESSIDTLVSEAQAGHTRANHVLYDRFQPCIRRVMRKYRYLPCADDISGEAYILFTDLVRRFDRRRGIPFPSYLAKMMSAGVHTWVRRQQLTSRREVSGLDSLVESTDRSTRASTSKWPSACRSVTERDPSSEPAIVRDSVERLLAALTPRQAFVFDQRAMKGEDFTRIAMRLNTSPAAVRVMYHEARLRLQKQWRRLYGADAC